MCAEKGIQAFILNKDGELDQIISNLYLQSVTWLKPHKMKNNYRDSINLNKDLNICFQLLISDTFKK